ncbi:unnamed protein product [Withania somnifera]
MGRKKITLRDLIGAIKDKASQSKATLLSKPSSLSLHLAVLRATTHAPSSSPPHDHHVSALLTLGDGSRATASSLIILLMDRLHRTGDSTVALKCLFIIHQIIKRGPFILQDQLSVFPVSGGRNYLKLSSFHDGATSATWTLSAWVRFYSRYLETHLFTSRTLGYFLCSAQKQHEKISCLLNADLIRDVDSLIQFMEELFNLPDSLLPEGNKLLYEVISIMSKDYLSMVNELLLRLSEFKERLSCLSFVDSVELGFILKRLQGCKERLSVLFSVKKPSVELLWSLVSELIEKMDDLKVDKASRRKLLTFGKSSESARFGNRVLKFGDSVQFSSGRYEMNNLPLMVVERRN